MTNIQDVDLRLVLGTHPRTAGKRYHWKGDGDKNNNLAVIGFEQNSPDGETGLTPDDMLTEAEIIDWWDEYLIEKIEDVPTPDNAELLSLVFILYEMLTEQARITSDLQGGETILEAYRRMWVSKLLTESRLQLLEKMRLVTTSDATYIREGNRNAT